MVAITSLRCTELCGAHTITLRPLCTQALTYLSKSTSMSLIPLEGSVKVTCHAGSISENGLLVDEGILDLAMGEIWVVLLY